MSNRRKATNPPVTSYVAHTPSVRLLQTALRGNHRDLLRDVHLRTSGFNEDDLRRLVATLAWHARAFASRVPDPERSQILWEMDNAGQVLARALGDAVGAKS